ncbi:hypothetical protein ACG2LH_12085 [Zhouia sp. PK063]|uniref:hypothetical protein n=1 Tax=Zhouia sp. PK063 TaxID=3373602 RepID=UPI00378BF701
MFTHKIKYLYFALGVLAIGCQQQKTPIKTAEKSITIAIDDRVELLRVAYFLALEDSIDVDLKPCYTDFYQRNFEPYKKYKNHPLVQKIRTGDEWNADLPTIALCLDKYLQPKDSLPQKELIQQFGWYGAHLDSLSKLLIDFKKTIKFSNSYNVNFKPFLDAITASQIPEKLHQFFRTDKKTNLHILFDPLNRITNKAITFTNNPKNERLFLITYLCDQPNDTVKPLHLRWNEDYRRIVIHENTHMYTNEFFSKYYDNTFDSIVHQEKFKDTYHDIDEIMVRGITAKILALNYGKSVGDEEIKHQPKLSKMVYDDLERYTTNNQMPFEKIYKVIIDDLRTHFLTADNE